MIFRYGNAVEVSPTGSVFIEPIRYAYYTEHYRYRIYYQSELVKEAEPYQIVSNLTAGLEYTLNVDNESNITVFATNFTPQNGTVKLLRPVERWDGDWSSSLTTMGGSIIGTGLNAMLGRYLWVGIDAGFAYYPALDAEAHFFILSPALEFGYYFIGDPMTDFRFGAGLDIGANYIAPYAKWEQIILTYYDYEDQVESGALKNYSIFMDTFLVMEWKKYQLKLKIRYDFTHAGFSFLPQIGLKF